MGVTKLETEKAIWYFDHEGHNIGFTPEADPNKIDVFVVEPLLNLTPDDKRQPNYNPGISSRFQGFKFAKTHGKDVWIADVPLSREYEGMIGGDAEEKAWRYWGPGLGIFAVGGLGRGFSEKKTTRRVFIGVAGVGISIILYGFHKAASTFSKLMEASEPERAILGLRQQLYEEKEVDMDDSARRAIAENELVREVPNVDLRNVVTAVKLDWLAGHLKEKSGRKPSLYMIYEAGHTGILDYLQSPEKRREALQKWGDKVHRYLNPRWLSAVTRWHYNKKEGWQPEVLRPKIPELEKPEKLPVDSIKIDRRSFLRLPKKRENV